MEMEWRRMNQLAVGSGQQAVLASWQSAAGGWQWLTADS